MQLTMMIGDIEIGGNAPYFWKVPYEGLGEPESRVSILNNSGESGGYLAGRPLFAPRQVPVNIKLMTGCPDEFVEARHKLYELMPLGELVDVVIRNEVGNLYFMKAMRTNNLDMRINSMVEADIALELVAPDATIYGYTNMRMNEVDVYPDKPGGIPWEADGIHWTDRGIEWLDGSTPIVITNNGDVVTYPIVVMSGTAVNPTIRPRGGDGVTVDITLGADDSLYIDMRNQLVLLNPEIDSETNQAKPNTGTSLRNNMIADNWWGLAPGNTQVEFVTTGTGKATVYWMDGYRSVL